jgi:predicted nucleotide-binding protein (sugar kinase/HSP70/actin superfamily)
MSPIHWRFLAPALEPDGYHLKIVTAFSRDAVDEGLRYVNNDACFPALVTIGQIVHELKNHSYDLRRTVVLMSQTGGGCRASNYVAFLRRALDGAGLGEVPVWPLTLGEGEAGGVRIGLASSKRAMIGLLLGDTLQRLVLGTRPYEKTPGDAEELLERWLNRAQTAVRTGDKALYQSHILEMFDDFAAIERQPGQCPLVGVVGEILINFHPEANNQAVAIIEREGGQAVLPELTDFFLYCLYDEVFRAEALAGSRLKKWRSLGLIWIVEKYREVIRQGLAKYPQFGHLNRFEELREAGASLVSLGCQNGEGWYLAADMALMLKNGVNNVLCLQPFGCLPNHITGKGVVKELKRRYPGSNLAAVDYDPGASEVNQINRIKLLMSVAHSQANSQTPSQTPGLVGPGLVGDSAGFAELGGGL